MAALGTLATTALIFAGLSNTSALATPPSLPVAAAEGHPADVSIPDTRRMVFVSKVNGHTYEIDVALPDVPPPPAGYPVIYVLDGYKYFAGFVEATRANYDAPQAIVVGIGYPNDSAWIANELAKVKPSFKGESPTFDDAVSHARAYDLTLLSNDPTRYHTFSVEQAIVTGGVDDFLKTIETEVKPRIYAIGHVNSKNQILFGHSFGGLAVIDALFTEPGAFRTFIAASPSIWWADEAVLRKEGQFATRVKSGEVSPHILITVGGDEETAPKLPPALSAMQVELEADIKKQRMIGNACDLAERLKTLHGADDYEIADCAVFPHQAHGVSVWPAIGRAVAFAFRR